MKPTVVLSANKRYNIARALDNMFNSPNRRNILSSSLQYSRLVIVFEVEFQQHLRHNKAIMVTI